MTLQLMSFRANSEEKRAVSPTASNEEWTGSNSPSQVCFKPPQSTKNFEKQSVSCKARQKLFGQNAQTTWLKEKSAHLSNAIGVFFYHAVHSAPLAPFGSRELERHIK